MSAANELQIEVLNIRKVSTSRNVKAYVDIGLLFGNGRLIVRSWAVVDNNSGSPWIGPPSVRATSGDRFYKVIEMEGEVEKQITSRIIDAYEEWNRQPDRH